MAVGCREQGGSLITGGFVAKMDDRFPQQVDEIDTAPGDLRLPGLEVPEDGGDDMRLDPPGGDR